MTESEPVCECGGDCHDALARIRATRREAEARWAKRHPDKAKAAWDRSNAKRASTYQPHTSGSLADLEGTGPHVGQATPQSTGPSGDGLGDQET